MISAIFLDRDGVIIQNKSDYVRNWREVKFLPGALLALKRLSALDRLIVIVTNQSAVNRGILSDEQVRVMNEQILAIIRAAGGRVDGVYLCPHSPRENCACRKPQPGLLLQATREFSIDLSTSWMVGDALSDIQAGQAAGVRQCALLLTGRGKDQLNLSQAKNLPRFSIFDDLASMTDYLADERGEV
jgi:D-glycero-D-manno-heptose 1,7-bisphosphate phosphatase